MDARPDESGRTSREFAGRFRSLIDAITDYAIFMLDPDGRVVSWNPGAERLAGYREEEVVGRHCSLFYTAEDQGAGKPTAALEQTVVHGRFEHEGWRVRKDGTRFWASAITTCLRDEGQLVGFVRIVRDLTDVRQREAALRTSEQFLAQSQRLAHLGNWMADLEAGTLTWSEELYRIYGVSPETFVPNVAGFVGLIHPDDRPAMRAQIEALRSGKRPPTIEFRIVRPDGVVRVIQGDGDVELNADHKPVRLIGTAQDITDRKKTEEELRRSYDLVDLTGQVAKVGGWELDLNTQSLRWTAETYRIHEIDPAVRPTVDEAIRFYAPEARPVIAAAVQAAIDTGEPFDLELPLITKPGRRIWVRAQGASERRDGRTLRLYGAFQDVTDRKHAEEEQQKLQAQFRQSQKMESVGQLASGIAHDFNNLLTVINGMSELVLARVAHNDPVRADIQEIRTAGERATTLTRQLLAFSRQQILEPRVINVNRVVAGMESLLRRLLGEDIELAALAAPDLKNVKADPGQLEQVITNLALNARDAMPKGGRLTIESRNVDIDEGSSHLDGVPVRPGPYVQLAVSDSGGGMDERTRARVFEPFFTTKGPGEGTGLGLSTVYGIIKQSQGFVWVQSELGVGTRFTILLPQVAEGTADVKPSPAAAPHAGVETILVVEDNDALRTLTTRFLQSAGYTILVAATGEDAMRLLASHAGPLQLLLTDVVMPGMSGSQLAERLAETDSAMKVLFMSGYTDDTVVRHGVLSAKAAFINKPFGKAALLRKVREVLDS